jgi:hypothetical protein
MHALKKAGLTIVTGSLIGAFATVAMADNNTLMNVGDYGSFQFPGPNGWGDQVWATDTDSTENGVLIQYMDRNGLAIQDSSGELSAILVDTAGSGYGQSAFIGGTTFQNNGSISLSDATEAPVGWWAAANVNTTGTGGFGEVVVYKVDGPAGGGYYQPGFGGQNDFVITNGSTGFMPGPTDSTYFAGPAGVNATNALTVTLSAATGSLGSFGFLQAPGAFDAGEFGIRPVYAGSTILGLGTAVLSAAVNTDNRNTTLVIVNDNATVKAQEDEYGNFRVFLGSTPNAANGTAVVGAGAAAGEVANLAIVANGTAVEAGNSANGNATSGIGYSAGNFMVYDADGKMVEGLTISYDVDDNGRVYTGALGAYNGVTDAIYNGPDQATITAGVNNNQGWSITKNNSNATDTAGWTVVPQGNGTGFECTAVHLYGQLIALQSMATNGSFDTTGLPRVAITAAGSGVAPSFNTDNYSMSVPHVGSVQAAAAIFPGQNFLTAPTVTAATADTGTGATFTALLGGVGQRMVTNTNGSELTLDLVIPEYELFTNGDFNGDGNSDLVWDSVEYGTYVWNMGADGRVLSAGLVASPGGAWDLVGCGQFDYSGVGSCMFWYNDETGQTAVWVVNSSLADTADWLVGGLVLETLEDMNWLARCTNNGTQNSGSNVYWHNADTGQFAVWPINVNDNGTTAALDADGAGFVTVGGGSLQEILLPASDGWSLVGAANMAGRPTADRNIQRDMILQSSNGTTAMWLMDDTGLAIDVTAATGSAGAGAGLVQYGGGDTEQDDSFVGVALYNVETIFSLNVGGGQPGFRSQQFPTLNWTTGFTTPDTEGGFTAATWKMDRNISLIDYDVTPVTGTGLSTMPWTIDFPVSW